MKWISSNRPNSNVELVIPIKNELLRLPRLLDFYSSFDIVFIDDSSTDGSLEFLLRSRCSVALRDRLTEQPSRAPTESAVIYYLSHLSQSGSIIKVDADEYIDSRYFSLLLSYQHSSPFLFMKKRYDLHYSRKFCFYNPSQPLLLTSSNFSSNLNSIHGALSPLFRKGLLVVDIPVIHDGNPSGALRLRKLLHYVIEERLVCLSSDIPYLSFLLVRYLRPLVLFPFRRFSVFLFSPRLFFFFFFIALIELMLCLFFVFEPNHKND